MAYGHNGNTNGSSSTFSSVAEGLGWFSIGLGLMEVAAPGMLARALGMEKSEPVLRAYGAREIGTGIGILSSGNPTPWLWGRVAGDALDLATLAMGWRDDNPRRDNVKFALAAVAGVTVLDVLCARGMGAEAMQQKRPLHDYSDRSGLPDTPEAMRGSAADLDVPRDMRAPEALRPYGTSQASPGQS